MAVRVEEKPSAAIEHPNDATVRVDLAAVQHLKVETA
jgi:hypothetical protein